MTRDHGRIADQHRPADLLHGGIERRLQAQFRTDPGGISDRNRDDRLSHDVSAGQARSAVSMDSTYSSPLATTSIEACARNGIMVCGNTGADAAAWSINSDVIVTL